MNPFLESFSATISFDFLRDLVVERDVELLFDARFEKTEVPLEAPDLVVFIDEAESRVEIYL